MQLPNEAIEEFKSIYLKSFDLSLTDEEAREKAESLFGLYDAVYGKGIKGISKSLCITKTNVKI